MIGFKQLTLPRARAVGFWANSPLICSFFKGMCEYVWSLDMVEVGDEEKLKYGQFVDLLNAIRGKDLISAQERRDLDKRWRSDPVLRDIILEDLERIMEQHAERIIKDNEPPSV